MRPATSTPAEPREMEDVAGGVAPGPLRVGVPISIIGAEDEDFENELEANSEEQNSQFQSLEQVKRRPAHLMALLQHVALQFEPGPLLTRETAGLWIQKPPDEAEDTWETRMDNCAIQKHPQSLENPAGDVEKPQCWLAGDL
ncbi:rho guanine nucleotide exchange factor 1-like isoform X2 [Sapajus apella]|uniref:Rho guanine nucleotide exchange factor 1-like isoform X2 n=1 Tax=Sapajus apella TaxID=9515 RepID=A0A6J3FIN9_SAPAP|nr:rho guanine nucleotide exchange factor 1-like isoform X2 [Sapajus apella]